MNKQVGKTFISALMLLKQHKHLLTKQQYRTFKGQILNNDIDGFIKGLNKILNIKGVNRYEK